MPEMQHDHGSCAVCGGDATEQCDYREAPGRDTDSVCDRWLCEAHLVIEAQHWDTRGWDGVDIRCQAHRNRSLDSRDLFRGHALPPAPRWEGDETGLLRAY